MLDTNLDVNPVEELKSRNGAASRFVGPYALRRELGRGGMSVVYEARDTRTGGEVALKLLAVPPTFAAEEASRLVARFEREARTMARLSHPNIIAVYEIGAADGQHFLAMEHLRGQTLRERLKQSKVSLAEAFAILIQVAGAMDAVHAAGIIHRDIKAANVMLLPGGTAKLLDFGIARSSEEATITNASAVIGTPAYMAPEQVRGEPASAATDLWSLSVLAYELFAGHAPFGGPIVANVLFQVTSKPPVPAPHLPKALGKSLRRALEKDPARRYPTAAALVQAVKSSLPKSVLPKSVLPKSVLPKQAPVHTGPKPAVFRLPSVPWWAQGAAVLLLFAGGFAVTAHERHPARPLSAMSHPALLPPAPVAALPVPVILRPAPQAVAPDRVQTEKQPQTAVSSAEVTHLDTASAGSSQAGDPSSTQAGTDNSSAAMGQAGTGRFAATSSPQERPQRPADLPAEAAAFPRYPGSYPQSAAHASQSADAPRQMQISVQTSSQSQASSQSQDSDQAQAVPQQAPAQAAPQAATLPDTGSGSYDPEAAARLRKRGWSQSDNNSSQ